MKVLFLTSRLPYPPYRGDKLKIWNLIRQVARRHEVILLSFIQDASEIELAEALRPYCEEVRLVRLPLWRSGMNCAQAALSRVPFQVAYFRSLRMRRELRAAIERHKPNLIHTHLIRLAPYTAGLGSIPRVLDMTDAVSLYLRRFRESQRNPLKKELLNLELKRMVAFEPEIARFDRVLVCSDVDREALLATVPDARIDLLYNGIDVETFAPRDGECPEENRIIFTGNMSYFPNADAARYLVREIFPRIKARVQGAKLYLVGQKPPSSVRSLASSDVTVTGFVEDIRAEYLKSAVAVSPVRFGAGTLNKILEPLSLGVPVVATSQGTSGLGLKEGEDILIADDPERFAGAVVRVLQDPGMRARMSERSARSVRSRFSWDAIGKTLLEIYDSITKGAKV